MYDCLLACFFFLLLRNSSTCRRGHSAAALGLGLLLLPSPLVVLGLVASSSIMSALGTVERDLLDAISPSPRRWTRALRPESTWSPAGRGHLLLRRPAPQASSELSLAPRAQEAHFNSSRYGKGKARGGRGEQISLTGFNICNQHLLQSLFDAVLQQARPFLYFIFIIIVDLLCKGIDQRCVLGSCMHAAARRPPTASSSTATTASPITSHL